MGKEMVSPGLSPWKFTWKMLQIVWPSLGKLWMKLLIHVLQITRSNIRKVFALFFLAESELPPWDPSLQIIPEWKPGKQAMLDRMAHFRAASQTYNRFVWICKHCHTKFLKLTSYEQRHNIVDFVCKEHFAGIEPETEKEPLPVTRNTEPTSCPNYCGHKTYKECLAQFVPPFPKPSWWQFYEDVDFE